MNRVQMSVLAEDIRVEKGGKMQPNCLQLTQLSGRFPLISQATVLKIPSMESIFLGVFLLMLESDLIN